MKILMDDRIYVSKKDVDFLLENEYVMPIDFVRDYYENNLAYELKTNIKNEYSFMVFTNPDVINCFKKIDFILDFNKSKLTVDELKEEVAITYGKKYDIEKSYDRLSNKTKKKKDKEIKEIIHKSESYMDIINYKNGKLELDLPVSEEEIKEKPKTFLKRIFK
ncbi:MAG: hypothetical protein IJ565_05700 [Bacilli bacterium]|nr:hypothetical protein [Bacilli bacterium]